jgi:hypothetical protein
VTIAKDEVVRQGDCWRSTDDGLSYRDLNGNGALDPYEDPRLPVEDRVADLIARMTLEEKAALLFQQGLVVPDDGAVSDEPDAISEVATGSLVRELGLTHFNIYWGPARRCWRSGTTECKTRQKAAGSGSRSRSLRTRDTASETTRRRA